MDDDEPLVSIHTLSTEEDTVRIMGFRFDLHKPFMLSVYVSLGCIVALTVLSLVKPVGLLPFAILGVGPAGGTFIFLKLFVDNRGPNYLVDLINDFKGVDYHFKRARSARWEPIEVVMLPED